MEHNKSNTAFLCNDRYFFLIYLSEVTYVISSFNLMTEWPNFPATEKGNATDFIQASN